MVDFQLMTVPSDFLNFQNCLLNKVSYLQSHLLLSATEIGIFVWSTVVFLSALEMNGFLHEESTPLHVNYIQVILFPACKTEPKAQLKVPEFVDANVKLWPAASRHSSTCS